MLSIWRVRYRLGLVSILRLAWIVGLAREFRDYPGCTRMQENEEVVGLARLLSENID